MKTHTLNEIKAIVSRLARQYGAERIYLFGSYARGDMTSGSDIDLRIDKGSIRGFQLAGLLHIVVYCQQIEQTVERFGSSAETFQNDPIYRNAAALCILQIGELVGKLTDEFREQHPAVPWRQIKAMRNIVAHSYGTVDPEITWEIITDEIPRLKAYCEQIIATEQ